MTLPPSGNNQKAEVVQYIGPVRISINYSSPSVHAAAGLAAGKDRHGHIWGELVPYGLSDLGFGNGKPAPWRAGANENTVFATSHDVLIEGKSLPAGHYGLHMIPNKDEWTIIFSKSWHEWGSFFYEESEDALRVNVKPHTNTASISPTNFRNVRRTRPLRSSNGKISPSAGTSRFLGSTIFTSRA
jgi:hypothetical protein